MKLVPIKEMTEVLTVEKKGVDLDLNSWVRVKIGVYKGDIGQVRTEAFHADCGSCISQPNSGVLLGSGY